MADFANPTQAAIRAALVDDAGVAALVADRVVDEPREDEQMPYVRFGAITPVPDDTDGHIGAHVTVSLEVHSRPVQGRVEAQAVLAAIHSALHRRPEVLAVAGLTATEIEVLTSTTSRAADGASYVGTVALEVHLDT